MPNRPHIPAEIRREVVFEARHRCAVCCEPLPLEMAHVVPWHETHDHSVENLIALCPTCHSRADNEKWGEQYLRRYKRLPCALASNSLPPLSAGQQALVDLIVRSDPERLNHKERQRIVAMLAAYLDISIHVIDLESVSQANSSLLTLKMPYESAMRLYYQFQEGEQSLSEMLAEYAPLSVSKPRALSYLTNANDGRETSENLLHKEIDARIIDQKGYGVGDAKCALVVKEAEVSVYLSWDMNNTTSQAHLRVTLKLYDAERRLLTTTPFYSLSANRRRGNGNFALPLRGVTQTEIADLDVDVTFVS